jgi:hypothetical protein
MGKEGYGRELGSIRKRLEERDKERANVITHFDSIDRSDRERIIDIYLSNVRVRYLIAKNEGKRVIEDKLDALISEINISHLDQIDSTEFSGDHARRLRVLEGLSKGDLAKKLVKPTDNQDSFRTQLSNWEQEKITPRNPPSGKNQKLYLNWLKEVGYNPYNL